VKESKKARWGLPPASTIFYHFGTSGVAVAMATAVTHPLGFPLYLLISIFVNVIDIILGIKREGSRG